jgi:mycothiol synthase
MTVELRPPRRDDAAGITRAFDEFGRVLDSDRITLADAETWLATPSLDLERDARVALVAGEVVAYADVFDPSHEGHVVWSDLRGDPRHPEAWPPLLEFIEARAGELSAPGGLLKAWSPEKADALRDLLKSHRFGFDHFSYRMVAALDDDLPEPEWPRGVVMRTFRDEDAHAVYDVHQETFSDLRDSAPTPFDDWRHWSFHAPFDPELWFLALAGGELQGVCLCRERWDGDSRFGWVSVLGVRRPWRGRGLGLALLRHAFRELRARGKTRVGLGVDAENPTGAVRLYERAGMEVMRRGLWYEKAV